MKWVETLDEDGIVESAALTGYAVTAEDHSTIDGPGDAVTETLSKRYPVPVRRVGLRGAFGEGGPNDALLDTYGRTARYVEAAAEALLSDAPACNRNPRAWR